MEPANFLPKEIVRTLVERERFILAAILRHHIRLAATIIGTCDFLQKRLRLQAMVQSNNYDLWFWNLAWVHAVFDWSSYLT